MIENGVYINILINLLICSVSIIYIFSLYKKYINCNDNSKPSQMSMISIWVLIFLYFTIDIIQQLLFISNATFLVMPLYVFSLIPLTLISVPIIFNIIYILTGNKYMSLAVSSIFVFFSFIYIYTTILSGDISIITSPIGHIISSDNNIANTIFLSAIFIVPTSMVLGLLMIIFLKQIPSLRKHKICLSLFSISMVYDFLFLTSISQTGEMIIASKIFILLGIILGFLSNFTPNVIKSRYISNIRFIE